MTGLARRARGFTLIEILVVVVIVGIMLAMAMPNSRNAEMVQRQVSLEKFVNSLEAAIFSSVVGGQHLRLQSDGQRYHFEKRRNDGSWGAITNVPTLKAGQLNDDVRVEQAWLDNKVIQPPLRIEFIGATPPMLRLRLRDGSRVIELETTATGSVMQTVVSGG